MSAEMSVCQGEGVDEALQDTQDTQQEVLDAHVLQHRLNSTEVFLTPTSIHRVSEMVGIHQIFQVVLPSPRIPGSWGRSQDSLGQWTLNRDSEHPCQTEAVRASITSSSFSPLPWDLGAHLFQTLWLTHSEVLGSEGNKGIAPSCRAGWVCRLP